MNDIIKKLDRLDKRDGLGSIFLHLTDGNGAVPMLCDHPKRS